MAILPAPTSSGRRVISPQQIVQEVKNLPAAPKVLPRLKRLLGDPNSSIDEIVRLIRVEPALSARVLKMANSPFHNKGEKCSTVDEAINRVGFAQVYDLVMYAVAAQVLVRPLAVYGLESDDLWELSVTCGLASEMLAGACRAERDMGYTIGLLYGIGMVAVDAWAMKHEPTLIFTPRGFPKEYTDSERVLLGCTHADVGGVLLTTWEFPPEAVEAIRFQYAPLTAPEHPKMASLLYAAKWLRSAACAPEGEAPPAPDPAFLEPLGVGEARLSRMVEDVKLKLEDVSQLLDGEG